jgi:CheY-like chemotaxis protein
MPQGGTIMIALDLLEAPQGLPPGGYLCLKVSDTGKGMDHETLKKAVEPFFSTKPVGKGTGLGLSTVHGLVVQLGGRLDLASEIDVGTTATLWLPQATQSPAAEVVPGVPAQRAPQRAATILVVDDDPLIAMSTVDMLEDLGHTVVQANSGQLALELIERGQPFDLLMTDQAMPGMTGIELAEIVQTKRPALPVLLATGYADLPSNKAGQLPRLWKPYQQTELQEHIDRLLAGSVRPSAAKDGAG